MFTAAVLSTHAFVLLLTLHSCEETAGKGFSNNAISLEFNYKTKQLNRPKLFHSTRMVLPFSLNIRSNVTEWRWTQYDRSSEYVKI